MYEKNILKAYTLDEANGTEANLKKTGGTLTLFSSCSPSLS